MVSRVTQGADFPGAENPLEEPGEVLVISGEDDPETALVPRLTVAGADLARIHIVKSVVLPDKGEREFQLDQETFVNVEGERGHPAPCIRS
jgi:hypothetical protein